MKKKICGFLCLALLIVMVMQVGAIALAEENTRTGSSSLPNSYFSGDEGTLVDVGSDMAILLPPGYTESERYNVVVLICSKNDHQYSWFVEGHTVNGRATNGKIIFNRMREEGKIPKVIFVSIRPGDYTTEDDIYNKLKYVIDNYSTYARNASEIRSNACHFAIAGFSQGGKITQQFFNRFGGMVNNYVIMSTITEIENTPASTARHLIVAAGTNNQYGDYEGSWKEFERLKGYAGHATFISYDGRGHDWDTWFLGMYDALPELCLYDEPKTGKITVHKESSLPALTNGNYCYDLEGVTFEIRNSEDELMDTLVMTSDNNYTDTSIELLAGEYKVVETVGGTGYEFDSTPLDVTVQAGKTKTLTIKNNPGNDPIGIIIKKIDADNNEIPIEGVEFTLKYYDTFNDVNWEDTATKTWVLKTNESGMTLLLNESKVGGDNFYVNQDGAPVVPYGTLLIKETKCPDEYRVDDTVRKIIVNESYLTQPESYKVFSITNKHIPMGKIVLEKKGLVFSDIEETTENGYNVLHPVFAEKYLAGATFELVAAEDIVSLGETRYSAGDIVDTLITTADGPVNSKELYYGKYILRETVTPEGYVKANDVNVTIDSETEARLTEFPVTIMNPLQKTDITLEKKAQVINVESDSGNVSLDWEPGEGFIFGLYSGQDFKTQDESKVISKDALLATAVSDGEGHVSFNGYYPIGQYYVMELKAPDERFIMSQEKYQVSTSGKGNMVSLISVKASENAIENVPDMAWAQIVKTDTETSQIVKKAGFKFDIFDSAGTKVDFVETDENGVAKLRMPLEHGKSYTVKETKAAEGYLLNHDELTLVIDDSTIEKIGDDEERYTLRFPDMRVKGSISIEKKGTMVTYAEDASFDEFDYKKLGMTTEYLSGAKFEIRAAEDIVYNGEIKYSNNALVAELVTVNGRAAVNDLYLGKYTVKEVDAPDGYVLVPQTTTVELAYADEEKAVITKNLSFGNDLRELKVSLEKHIEIIGIVQDSDGNIENTFDYVPGEGIVFGLYTANDIVNVNTGDVIVPADTLINVCASDEEGLVAFTGKYPVGNYYVKELKTLPKYQLLEDFRYDINNAVDDDTIPLAEFKLDEPVKNDYVPVMIKIRKTDMADSIGLPGARLEIRDENGVVIYSHVTNEDGALEDIKLVPGTYTLREIFSPNGYALNEEEVTFVVKENGTVDGETVMRDDVTRFSFYKINEKGEKLAGAEFTMYDDDGNVYAVVDSDENGIETFENMMVGKYIIKETKALPDYQLSSETITLEVTNEWLNSNSYNDGGELIYSIMNYKIIKTGIGLSTGAIIAIVAGCIAIVGAAGAAFVIVRRRKHA